MAEEDKKEKGGGGGGNTLLLILIILLFIIVMALGGLVVYLLLSKGDGGETAAKEETAIVASAEHGGGDDEDEEVNPHAKQYSPKYKQFPPPPPDAPPQYFEMKKLVVNFKGEGKAKFLAVDLKFMTYYPQVVEQMEHLRPILLNDIIQHLRVQTYTKLNQDDGPEKLRKEILEIARKVLDRHGVYPDLLEDVYLERFVMQ